MRLAWYHLQTSRNLKFVQKTGLEPATTFWMAIRYAPTHTSSAFKYEYNYPCILSRFLILSLQDKLLLQFNVQTGPTQVERKKRFELSWGFLHSGLEGRRHRPLGDFRKWYCKTCIYRKTISIRFGQKLVLPYKLRSTVNLFRIGTL